MEGCSFRRELVDAKRIVVKVGTSTLTYENGKINFSKIDKLSRVLSDLMNQGKELVLVTSGAVGIGMSKLKLKSKPQTTKGKTGSGCSGSM